ncbi:hypothetical protein PO124_16420 [Bacillus licheniformis]|nr:hypothetical protein [Bacillus licheniformis]
MINETFKWGSYDSVLFISNDKSGVEFETFGMLADMAIMHQTQNATIYMKAQTGAGSLHLQANLTNRCRKRLR